MPSQSESPVHPLTRVVVVVDVVVELDKLEVIPIVVLVVVVVVVDVDVGVLVVEAFVDVVVLVLDGVVETTLSPDSVIAYALPRGSATSCRVGTFARAVPKTLVTGFSGTTPASVSSPV